MRALKITVLIVTFFITYCSVFSQTNYVRGYYVKVNSDTIHGFVELRAESKMIVSIRFKPDLSSLPYKLTPDATTAVVIDDKNFYESHSAAIGPGQPYLHYFFKVRIFGRITLYTLDNSYFVKKGNDSLLNITKRQRQYDRKLQTDFSGLGLLKAITADCPNILQQTLVDQYASPTPDYVAIVTAYNACYPEQQLQTPDIEISGQLDIGIQVSGMKTKLDYAGSSSFRASDFGRRPSGSAGLLLSYFTPSLGDNIRFVAEPSVGIYSGYSFFVHGSGKNDLSLSYKYIRVPVTFRYFYVPNLFVEVGVTNFFPFSQDNSWRQEQPIADGTVVTTQGPDYSLKNRYMGAIFGLGAKISIGSIPMYLTGRFSTTFPYSSDVDPNQPIIQGLEVNVGVMVFKR